MQRVAMVGVGGFSKSYRAIYGKLPSVSWELAVDVNPLELERCRALGAKRTSSRFEDALADDIDLVVISTPNHLHEPQAAAALRAGKHVLLQKPMTNSLEAADRILAAAKASSATLGMYMSALDHPLAWEIKRMIQTGCFGRIQSVRGRDAHRGGLQLKPAEWRCDSGLTGGGSFIQIGVHSVDLIQWWLDASIEEVCAQSCNRFCPQIQGDDYTAVMARFSGGERGLFESAWASDGGRCREVYGTGGHVRMTRGGRIELMLLKPHRCGLFNYDQPGEVLTFAIPEPAFDDAENPHNQHRAFVEHLEGRGAEHVSGERGRHAQAVVTAIHESARIGKPVRVAHSENVIEPEPAMTRRG